MSLKLSDIGILNIQGVYYGCIISGISKSEAINIIPNTDLTKKGNITKHENLLPHVKMGKDISTFVNIEIEKNKFYSHKSPISLKDADIKKVSVSDKIPFGEKKL